MSTEARWSKNPKTITVVEADGIDANRFLSPAGDYVAAEGGVISGVTRFASDLAGKATVYNGDEALIYLAETVAVGDLIQSDNAGKGVKADAVSVVLVTGSDSPDLDGAHVFSGGYLPQHAVWVAREAGDADDVILIEHI